MLLLTLCLSLVSGRGELVITEIMAANRATLADEDKSFPDWIEVYNPDPNPVNLGGWYLANSAANLTKWQFPSTNLGPRSFLVVFASDKNRRVAGAPLHTNFKLSSSGEYLALVRPDGVTKVSEFAPAFPPQFTDISYGYRTTGSVTTLIAPDAAAHALVPTGNLGNSWQLSGFNDSAWTSGRLGVGYDSFGNYASAIGLDLASRMSQVNASAYIRVPFTIADPGAFNRLTLNLRYDDGFIAYLNGNEILRRNAPAPSAWNSSATATHGTPAPGRLDENFEGPAANYNLSQYGSAPGPAIQAAAGNSTGRFLRILHDGVNGSANSIAFNRSAPGRFDKIVADFDFRIASAVNNPADGFAFLLIPTALYGTNGPGVNTSTQGVEKPNFPKVFGIGFGVYPHYARNDVSVHWDGTEKANVPIPSSTIDLAAGVFHHAQVTLQYVNGGALISLTLTADINGHRGSPFSPIETLFLPGLSSFDCRVQFGGRTGGLNMDLDLDNCQVQFLPPAGPIAFEDFDLTGFSNLLLPGSNVLAIHGLNVAATNSNFLIQPELTGHNLTLVGGPTYLSAPTPGSWNPGTGAAAVPTISFWPPAGVYNSNRLAIALAASSSAATIRFTVDGSTPTSHSQVYTNPIVLSTNTAIRARAEFEGVLGAVGAANYILLDGSVSNFTSNLPLLIIDTLGQPIPDGSKIGAYAVVIDTNTPSGRTSLRSPPDYRGRVAIGLHGSSSLMFPKKPYNLELNDEDDKSVAEGLLGMPAGSDWLLYPPFSDKTLMNNVLSYELFEAMGHYSVRRHYVEVFLHTTPGPLSAGDYLGLYVLVERIRVDQDRVDIATLSPSDNLPPTVTGGYLLSKDRIDPGSLTVSTPSGQELLVLYPKPDKITTAQYQYIQSYLNTFETALYGPNWLDALTGYAAYIDVDSLVDYHWIVEYPKNIDGSRLSNFISKDRNGKVKMEPIWDWDLTWGNADYAEGGKTNGWYYPMVGENGDIWLYRLRTDPDFYQKIIDRWGELRLTVFNTTNLQARMDQLTNYLGEAQGREFSRWPRLGEYVWPNPNGAAGGWDVDYVTPTTYAGIIAQSKRFHQGRYRWIDSQFVPAPTLITNSATAILSAPLGLIYFTVNGTDPRTSGGGVSPDARQYVQPLNLSSNVGIFARAFFTNSWSAPARAVHVTEVPALRITEINYHPAAPPTNSPYVDEDFEFVEIQNTGATILNLSGASLTGGIDFTFSPNEWKSVGLATSNRFDEGGTPFIASTLGQIPGAYRTNDGPSGDLLCLLNSGTNLTRNRFAFNATAPGVYDRLVADFDFRAITTAPTEVSGPPTRQNFDSTGTSFSLMNAGPTTPAVLTADSGSAGSFLRLVPSASGEVGAVAFDRTATGAYKSIVATFDFRIAPPSEGNQADGLGFALLSTTAYGTTGMGPVFGETPNLQKSLGIGFDVYNNGPNPVEPNNNHISLHWNGAQIGDAVTPSFDLSNGKFHRAQVLVWFSGSNAYVTLHLTPDINGSQGRTETILKNAVIVGATAYESRAAFGARTGGAWAAHDLDNIIVDYTTSAASSAGLSLLVLPTARFGTAGSGTSLATFLDAPAVSNVLALDLSFNPGDQVNDLSLYWNGALVRSVFLPAAGVNLDSGGFHHARLRCDSANGGVYATLDLTPDSLGSAGMPINVFSNQLILGAQLLPSRLEFAGRNGGLNSKIDCDNILADFQARQPLLLSPGESLVVVRNAAAFVSRYGASIRLAGEYTGSLNNAGDRLVLLGPVGEPILDFQYSPNWWRATDGAGFSLVVADPSASTASWGLARNWRPSATTLGSPGTLDPLPHFLPPIRINEVLAQTDPPLQDSIELYNPATTNVDVSGWFLTDDLNSPAKFRIPDGTWIGAGSFFVFQESDFNSTPTSANSFALNGEGDEVWLFSATPSGELTGYVHGWQFGASDRGVSIGRHLNSQGVEQFVAQVTNSFGTANSGPLVGPVVISEIMYLARSSTNASDLLEYIELQNITAAPVPLFSLNRPLETWQLRNAVQFDFPTNLVLGARQPALVVGFDPINDNEALTAFRASYAISTNLLLFGPWQGHLADSEERIELRKPGPMTAAGNVPSVLVEAVHYGSTAPWPTAAAGRGGSLQRATLTTYADDPANWYASPPSPGATNILNRPPTISIMTPSDGSVLLLPANYTITAQAADTDGFVTKLEFFVDGLKVGEVTNAPYRLLWTGVTPGAHQLTIAAYDNWGNRTLSIPVVITGAFPPLAGSLAGGNLELNWPGSSPHFRAELAHSLVPPIVWTPITNLPVFVEGRWRIWLTPPANGVSFYRLPPPPIP
jgi:hypothetical protein